MKALALLAPLVLLGADDHPRFAPAAGSVLKKSFSETTTLTLEDAVMSVNGEEQDNGEIEMEVVHRRLVTVTDTYTRVRDGRADVLAREFESIEAEFEGDVQDGGRDVESFATQGTGELEGHAVDFTWDEDEGRHVPTFAEGDDGDAELLEGLEQDMDLLGFLPGADASVGAKWEVPLDALRTVLRPAFLGVIPFEEAGEDVDAEGVLFLSLLSARDACDELEGDLSAEWVGSVDENGRKLVKIELDVDVVMAADLSEDLLVMAEGVGADPEQLETFTEISVESTVTGDGVLYWDVEAGRVASLELGLQNEVLYRLSGENDMGGGVMEVSIELVFAGTTEILVETEQP